MAGWLADAVAPDFPWAALAVALPLAAALGATLSVRLARALAWPMGLAGIVLAIGAALQVATHGVIELRLGGWHPPLGITLRLDGMASGFLLAGALVAAAALAAARPNFAAAGTGPADRKAWAFWPLAFCLLAATYAAFLGADLFNLYVALELLTIAAVALVALEGSAEALSAAMRYLLFALLGSLAYLLGVALLYAAYGTLDLQSLRALAGNGPGTALPAALITVGLMAKAALFPLHGWLPAAHACAPAPASALLSALVVKVPFLILLRVWSEALPGLASFAFAQFMGLMGAAAIVVGSLLALRQVRLKLVIAYSTVAQLGYLLLVFPLVLAPGTGAWGAAAWAGVVFHGLAHALAKGAMFLSAGAMAQALGSDRIDAMAGLGRALPIAAFAFGIAAVSLMGLPPSGGFLAKYLLLRASLGSGQWWWALPMLGGGLLAVAYLFRPMEALLAKGEPTLRVTVPRGRQAIALALALASVALGLLSAQPFGLLQVGRVPLPGNGL